MSILAIIPARGGSRGIPKKNIYPVGGKPLIAWTIEAAKNSRYIIKIVVSSDSDDILDVAKTFGVIPIKRPDHLATDNAPPEPLIPHVLEYMKNTYDYVPETLIYLQPTSPLRNEGHIDEAYELFLQKKANALNSVFEIEKKYLKTFIDDNGYLKASVGPDFPSKNRQDLPSVFMPNGAIYIIRREEFLKTHRLFSDKTIPYIMSQEHSIDVDTIEDIIKLNAFFEK